MGALQPVATCRHISGRYLQRLSQLLSLWCHSRGSCLRRSHIAAKPAILIMMSLATELATPSVMDVRTPYRI